GIRDFHVTGVQTCALPIWRVAARLPARGVMRTLEEHKAAVAAHLRTLPTLDVALEDARGAMLAAPVIVHEDVPPVPTAACDGYEIGRASCRERGTDAVAGE